MVHVAPSAQGTLFDDEAQNCWEAAQSNRHRMTPHRFRRMALALEGVIESAHQGHPDFRVGGRIFATLGYPDRKWGAVMLAPDQQRAWVRDYPDVFVPAKGKWGEQGSTIVRLQAGDEEILGEVLTLAWQNTVAKGGARARARRRSTASGVKARR